MLQPSYQTAPLSEYRSEYQFLAEQLFQKVENLVGVNRAKNYKGSYSIFFAGSGGTAAKIVIFEDGLGKINGAWPVREGVYILTRDFADTADTIGIAPKHDARFRYVRAEESQTNEVARSIAAAAAAR